MQHPVAAAEGQLEVLRPAFGAQLGEEAGPFVQIGPDAQLEGSAADHLLALVAGELEEAFVELEQPAVVAIRN